MPVRNLDHQKLVDDILTKAGSLPHLRLWIRVVGFDKFKKIKYGITGESDIDGIIYPSGKKVSIECKTGKAKLSKEQIAWREMIIKFGGIHIEARCVEDVLNILRNPL